MKNRGRNGRAGRVDWRWWLRAGSRLGAGVPVSEIWPAGTVAGDALRRGCALTESLREAGWPLPRELWAVLEAGERTGRLPESLERIGQELARREEQRRLVRSQAAYPLLVAVVGLLVTGMLVVMVIPRMRELLGSLLPGEALPLWTRQIGTVYGFGFVGMVLLGGLGLFGAVAGERLARHLPRWGAWRERMLSRMPVVGGLRFREREARLLRQWSILVEGGWTVPAALEFLARQEAGLWERRQLEDLRKRLLMGESFAVALERFGPVAAEDGPLLAAGHESGRLEDFLERVAADLERRNRWERERWLRFLEPAMLAGLTLAVGGLLVAYFLPLVRLMETSAW